MGCRGWDVEVRGDAHLDREPYVCWDFIIFQRILENIEYALKFVPDCRVAAVEQMESSFLLRLAAWAQILNRWFCRQSGGEACFCRLVWTYLS